MGYLENSRQERIPTGITILAPKFGQVVISWRGSQTVFGRPR
ncbi:MAG: hypothetical protein AB7S52_03940 [Sphaerochaetaceae bacterium]